MKFVKIDVNTNPDALRQFGVRAIPTLMIFNGGKAVGQVVGAVPKSILAKRVEEATGLKPEKCGEGRTEND